MIHFACPFCKAGLKTGSSSGKAARCPNCMQLIEIPQALGPSALPADAVETANPAAPSASPDPQRQRLQRKTNFFLLGLAVTGLGCAGFLIVDFIARGDSGKEPGRRQRRPGGVEQRAAEARPAVPPRQPPPPEPRVQQPTKIRWMATAPTATPRLRLGTLRFRQGGRVHSLAGPSENNLLASCGRDGKVRIWNAQTGEAIQCLSGGGEPLLCVALSRDGRGVAAGGQGGMLYYWDVATGKELQRWQSQSNAVQDLALAPDGKTLASVSFNRAERDVFLWDAPTATMLHCWRTGAGGQFAFVPGVGGQLAFAPDGKTLAASVSNTWGVGMRESVRFAPDGTGMIPSLADNSPANAIRLLDLITGQEQRGPDSGVAMAYSLDGRVLAIGGANGSLRLREPATGKLLHTLEGHSGFVLRITFSSDSKTLASLGSAGDVRLWDVAGGKERRRIQLPRYPVAAMTLSGDGGVLYTGGDDHVIRLWDTATGEELPTQDGQGAITALALAPEGNTAILAGMDATLYAWDLSKGQVVRRYRGNPWAATCVAISTNGRLLASGGRLLKLWDLGTGEELRQWDDQAGAVGQVKFLPDDRSFAAVKGREGRVCIYETATGKELQQFSGSWSSHSSFSPDGTLLALWGSQDVQLWNVATRSLISDRRPGISTALFGGSAFPGISAQALSPGGRYIAFAASSDNGAIHVLNMATGKEVDLPRGHAAPPTSWRVPIRVLAWSHDGKILASGGGDGQVWLWDVAGARALLRCPGHEGPVTALAFSSDDRTLISGSEDTTALVWDLTAAREGSQKRLE